MADRNRIEYNWYEILGLEYYPVPEENEEKIKAKIEEKRKEWLRKETDPLNGTKYKNYGELLKHGVIESEMLNSAKRKELIRDAQNKLFEPIDKFLKYFEGSIITSKKIKEIAEKTKRKEDLIKKRIEENGKIELYDEKIYKNYCEYINRKYEFLTVEQNLKILDKKDLYEFLNSENINVNRLDARGIIENIKEKRKDLIKSDNETSAKKKLFTECEKIFGDVAKRKEYDEYLKYLKYINVKKELEEIKTIYEVTDKQVSNKENDNFNNIKNILNSEKEAKNIFIGFCEANKIPYNISNSSKDTNRPQNTYKNDNNELKKLSEAACERALNAIENFRFNEAVKCLNEARNYWPGNPRIEMIRKRMNEKAGSSPDNYYSNNNQNRSGTNITLIVIGVILFIIMAVMIFLTAKNLSPNFSNNNHPLKRTTQDANNFSDGPDSTPETTYENTQPVDPDHETRNGYTYLKNDGKGSTFSKRDLGYEEGMMGVSDNSSAYENIKTEYCNAVNEIVKVDDGIVPGTNTPFRQATYTEVDDAYKEYLQKIAQMRQVVFLLNNRNDSVIEPESGCFYKGTRWNTANFKYKAREFERKEIDDYYNNYGN
ncbi:Uncharacterised protein [uncultured Leptotrichia sp.]|uniref:hypothetical protein n=1 Tax=uncultured Leptotrichia sp. TaxID=159271 RepID=UPI001A40482E|nr:hypothetical protein [uncultured Leptotrichia sp.]VTX51529.1 Uncharacterised protein [uncultured Leptotrichia sp.]